MAFQHTTKIITRGIPATIPYNGDETLFDIARRALRQMGDDAPDTMPQMRAKWELLDERQDVIPFQETGNFIAGPGFKQLSLILLEPKPHATTLGNGLKPASKDGFGATEQPLG